MRRFIARTAVVLFSVIMAGNSAHAASTIDTISAANGRIQQEQSFELGAKKTAAQIKREQRRKARRRNQYLSESAFIGNSISVGLKMYFDSKGSGYLGGPVMMVRGCYSFRNDTGAASSKYQIAYNGRAYRAADAIKASKVKRVFINMGTNDLWKPVDDTYKDYVSYIKGIRRKNPSVVIFIQATTPMCSSRNGKYLNNTSINTLNSKMKKYCEEHRNLYFIDITKGMKDAGGGLKSQYTSDGYVHINMSGYEIWTNNVIAFVDDLIDEEKKATDAVKKVERTKKRSHYRIAREAVNELKAGTTRRRLRERLQKVKKVLIKDK